jgi:predicted dehydrogenase
MPYPLNRRRFIEAAGAGLALAPALHAAGKSPPSDRIRVGLIGCGGRGRQLLEILREFPDVDVPVISDCLEPRMAQAARMLAESPRPQKCEQTVEHERILDRNDVDAVVIATTQHWHGRPFIQAAQSGKHIYVEKPLSHTVVEGRRMVEAAKKHGVIAMMGTQQRNYPHYVRALEILRSGALGKIALVECWNYSNTGRRVGRADDTDPPPGYHWDRWLGPAPYVPFNPTRLPGEWWFAYGGGMMTNWTIHHIDFILTAMDVTAPTAVAGSGGKFVVDDLADTPDTILATWEFPDFLMQYRYRGFNNFHTVQSRPNHHGICFHGSFATMLLDRSGFEVWEDGQPIRPGEKSTNPRHWRDGHPGNEVDGPWQRLFIDCIKANERPPLELEHSHRATVCCHLANIAYLCGRKVRWDAAAEAISGDEEAASLLDRPRRDAYALPSV